MRPRPPQHTIDGEAVWIPPDDEAWKTDTDTARKGDGWDTDHEIGRYYDGETRYRLDEVESHIDRAKLPEEYVIRDLGGRERVRLVGTLGGDNTADAWISWIEYGLETVRPEALRDRLGFKRVGGKISRKSLDALIDHLGMSLAIDLGVAIMSATEPLSESEGKQSGSTRSP